MSLPTADVALIDVFEKIRAYLLEHDPQLETGLLARPEDPARWSRLNPRDYQEIFLAVLLDIDRGAAAGRRVVRRNLEHARRHLEMRVSDEEDDGRPSARAGLFRHTARERWLRENIDTVADAIHYLSQEGESARPLLIEEICGAKSLRAVVLLLRKRMRQLGGLRVYEFLGQIGYPVVLPDAPRQRLFQRLGWIEKILAPTRFPEAFFEMCERLVRLTGEPWQAINAVTRLFAGSRSTRAAGSEAPAVCIARPRCKQCVVSGQCAYFRYRGDLPPAVSRSVKQMAYAEQPRTRFETLGPANLSESELLALIIRTGAEGKSSLDLAREVIERFGSLDALARAGIGELCEIRGIGRAKAIELKAALELGRRLLGGPVGLGETIHRSADVFEIYRGLLEHEQQENFYLVVLNTRNRIQNHFLISRGSLTSSPVHPREVMKVAVREAAASVAFVHNHPSGEPEPSQDDIEITERLVGAARLMGIRVLDHVIIGRDNYFSFADHHLLEPGE